MSLNKYRNLAIAIGVAVSMSHYGLASAAIVSKTKSQPVPSVCKGLAAKDLKYMDSQVKMRKDGKFNDYTAEVQEDEDKSQSVKTKLLKCYKAKLKAQGIRDEN